MRSRLASFGYAFRGIKVLLFTQAHAQFHLLATLVVVGLAFFFGITRYEWVALILAVGLVWLGEAINTAIELIVDLVHPEWGREAGQIKDVAAGAVLLSAIAAAAIGILVFAPYIRLYLE